MNDAAGIEPTPDSGKIGHDTDRLLDYAKIKHAVARAIRSLRSLASEAKNDRAEEECRELMSKLAEDRFTLAVVGQFKRGKSSLMNAILGRDILPTGVLTLTSAITTLRYGPVERLTILRERHSISPECPPVSELAAYVTERGNPGNLKRVKEAVLEMPSPFLRRGLEFVDTPGVGSAIAANTQTTYAFLPQCDAVVFVTSVDSPLSEVEMDFLRCVRRFAHKVFFAINKTDLLEGATRAEVIAFISDRLRAGAGCESLRIHPLSASGALAAKFATDSAAYAASGLKDFEEALGTFLALERTNAFLASLVARAVRLLEDLSPAMTAGALQTRCADIGARLGKLRQSVAPDAAPGPVVSVETASPRVLEPQGVPPETSVDWPQALKTRGCPVCALIADAAFNFYRQWQYTLSVDETAQDQFAAAMGLCGLHTWQLVAISSPQGSSAGYAKLAEECARKLSQFAVAPDAAAEALEAFSPGPRRCPACARLREVEKASIHSLASFLKETVGLRIYRDSPGVCLRHLAQVIRAGGDSATIRRLLQHASARFGETAEDMQNFAMKREGLRGWLVNDDERDAYLRAIVHIVGERRVCAPWREDFDI